MAIWSFSNTRIGLPTASAPDFFYNVGAGTVTVTYNLPTGITLMASGVEQEDGTASTVVTWAQATTAGTITGIAAGETFWLSLTFQTGAGADAVTHTVRRKFTRPGS